MTKTKITKRLKEIYRQIAELERERKTLEEDLRLPDEITFDRDITEDDIERTHRLAKKRGWSH